MMGSQIPKMLRADNTEDEGYASMDDMADPLDYDKSRYISKAIGQSTQIIHQTVAYVPILCSKQLRLYVIWLISKQIVNVRSDVSLTMLWI